ncbi:hypothetical protein [Pararhizobium gei]|uniref:hypothetical protein n=1 Tax=Pararhizobium gei TaxID=1395951 RepID=UPI0023DAAC3B|nr:hypothetical protein [Rhizobium gei]
MRGWLLILMFGSSMLLPAGLAAAADTDFELFGRDPGQGKAYACYSRSYTREHLAAHPDQNVRDMTVFVNSYDDQEGLGRQYSLTMSVNFRQLKQPFNAYGGCRPGEGGKQALNCGIDCDGGSIGLRVKDHTSILLDIPYGARVSDDAAEEEEPGDLPKGAKFGADDKLFRLDRAAMSACLALADDETKAALAATP